MHATPNSIKKKMSKCKGLSMKNYRKHQNQTKLFICIQEHGGAITIKKPRLESLPKIAFYMACMYWSIKYHIAFKM
jgi:hypothetical protein